MQRWLQKSPFFILSSCASDGIDCSPRGDEPGTAFQIIDKKHLAIPDRRGNNRIDTLNNILIDPRVGLVFLMPGVYETLRVKGEASITVNPELLQRFQLKGITPATVMLVNIQSVYVQNARAIRAAELWKPSDNAPETIPSARDLSV